MWIYFVILTIILNGSFWFYFKKKDIIYDDLINFYRIFLGYSVLSLISFVDLFYDKEIFKYNIMSLLIGFSLMVLCEVYKSQAEKKDSGYCE